MSEKHPNDTTGRPALRHGDARHRFTIEKKQAWLYLCFFASLLFWECVVRAASRTLFFGEGLVFTAVFAASLAGLYTAVCGLLPPRAGRVASIALLSLTGVFYTAQLFYFSIFNTYMTAFSVFNGTQALQFGETIWSQLTRVWYWVLMMLAPVAAFVVLGRRLAFRRSPFTALLALAAGALLHLLGVGLLYVFGTGLFTPYDYYTSSQSLNPTAGKLGLYTTIRLDAKRLMFPQTAAFPTLTAAPKPAEAAPPAPEGPAPARAGGEAGAEKAPGPNVLDIDFTALAAGAENPVIADIHSYFASVEPTMRNDYTGMFEGYNLVFITAESFAPYAVDEALTPTLYKMANKGMRFENYYIPLWDTSTLDGEYAILQGLVPKQGVWSMMVSGQQGHTLPFTLGNQFLSLGYSTYAYHNHNAEYYNRAISHPNLGYTVFRARDAGLNLTELGWPESDLEMVDITTDEFIGDGADPFHVYYLTVSGHQPYESWNAMALKNWDAVADLPLTDRGKAYLACNIELDRALELLMERLNEAGVAEKTVIALTADHPPYALQLDGISELLGHQVDYQFEDYDSAFFIYCQGMAPLAVEKYSSSLDILPTLSNLFGLEYDSRLLMGRDILSDAEPVVIFSNRSWITGRARFSAYTGVVTSFDEANPADDEYIQRIHKIVAERFAYSARIVENNYYALLLPPADTAGAGG
jgi:arylsulfatase A-like enzyme